MVLVVGKCLVLGESSQGKEKQIIVKKKELNDQRKEKQVEKEEENEKMKKMKVGKEVLEVRTKM